ncbi:MAG: hypothetical protein RL322_2718 [Pseudomonadota bacterium]|jgi:hypothetical protein
MSTIGQLNASSVTRLVNENAKAGGNLQMLMMAIAYAQVELNQTKGNNIAKAAQSNVNRLDAANQLTSQLKALEALRAKNKIDKDKTMEGQAAECKQFVENLKSAGIEMTPTEFANWSAGKITDADLKTIESRIKTMSDNASSQSQMINLDLQKTNNNMQQATNMFMAFMDTNKQMVDRIFR